MAIPLRLLFPPIFGIPQTAADRSILLIGRHPQCDVVLPVMTVSRRHCMLAEVDEHLTIRDLGSRHGLWVNGRRVEEQVLHSGDEIAIGPIIVKVVDATSEIAEETAKEVKGPDSAASGESPTQLQADPDSNASYDSASDSEIVPTEAIVRQSKPSHDPSREGRPGPATESRDRPRRPGVLKDESPPGPGIDIVL